MVRSIKTNKCNLAKWSVKKCAYCENSFDVLISEGGKYCSHKCVGLDQRRSKDKLIWLTKEFRDARDKNWDKKNKCEWCDATEILVPSHDVSYKQLITNFCFKFPYEEAYKKAREYYLSFKGVTTLCKKCHMAKHKGYLLCIKCKKRYYNRKYKSMMCYECVHSP